MESLTVESSPDARQVESMTEVIQKIRSQIVSVRDNVSGCYECINDCAVDHVTVGMLDNVLALLDTLNNKG